MEILDTYFSHVCELDLVWHFHKARAARREAPTPVVSADAAVFACGQVYMILDEFILAGEIQETSKKVRRCSACFKCMAHACCSQVILERMEELERMEVAESGTLLDRMAAGI